MLVDGFSFRDEFDILRLRLETLWDVVDRFVAVEAAITFSGKPKPLYLKENPEKWDKYRDKLVVIEAELPDEDTLAEGWSLKEMDIVRGWGDNWYPWVLNWMRAVRIKDQVRKGFGGADWLIIGDVDEIPRPEVITDFQDKGNETINDVFTLSMDWYLYYMNWRSKGPWPACKILQPHMYWGWALTREHRDGVTINNAGWHMSWMGDPETKLNSMGHQEFNTAETRTLMEFRRANGLHPAKGVDMQMETVPLSHLPKPIQENKQWYEERGYLL